MVRIVFLHPDLGIGGAERAVIDAGLALKSRAHDVQFFTSHHSPDHCFKETSDGTLQVTVAGDWLPRSILGRCYALCAYIRMIYTAVYLVFFSGVSYDLVFCDQISACIPVLRLRRRKVLFYCHFPDMLLTARDSWLKRLYRAPVDWVEEMTTGMADCVLVNSKFTAGIFHDTFSRLRHISPQVLHPIPDLSSPVQDDSTSVRQELIKDKARTVFLSINRYERKKNLALALEALSVVCQSVDDVHLIMAGGYDDRVLENKQHFQELCQLSQELGVRDKVTFLCSISDSTKSALLSECTCLLYTPDREHFGIVPVEAMFSKLPVIAVNSGGPMETVLDGVTGFLCEPTPAAFAEAMMKFVNDEGLVSQMGTAARERVVTHFSPEAFSNKLNGIVTNLCPETNN